MRNVHIWKVPTETREKKEVRAERFGGRWRFQSKRPSDPAWVYFETPSLEELQQLRDILWRKYQRKRLPHDDVASIDALIATLLPPQHSPHSTPAEPSDKSS
jgi:hypothetical protein